MTTDIHDLDQYLGRYVEIADPDGESAAGFLVKVHDAVDFIPEPVRSVMLDWGQGWRIGATTEVNVLPAPDGQKTPQVISEIDVLHEFAHDGGCPDGNCRVRARRQLRALRVWRMKQEMGYWKHTYVRPAQKIQDRPDQVAEIIEKACADGAPEHVLDHLRISVERTRKVQKS